MPRLGGRKTGWGAAFFVFRICQNGSRFGIEHMAIIKLLSNEVKGSPVDSHILTSLEKRGDHKDEA